MVNSGIRLGATAIIWFFSTGMLGLCIPLLAMGGRSIAIVPLAVIVGASIGTVVVWRVPKNQGSNQLESRKSVKQLEERIANLEIICSSGEVDLQQKIKNLESKD